MDTREREAASGRANVLEKARTVWGNILAFIERFDWAFFICAAAVLAFCLFYKLGAQSVQCCDEARHGINAYEMLQTKDYLLSTYQYETDYFNLKPPLSYWCIALCYRIFGYSRFAMRFYSAISYFATAIMLALFLRKRCGRLESIACLGMFLAQDQMIFQHMARNADADALFVFLFSAAVLLTIQFCESRKRWRIYLACFLFALAFLCKSWHAGAIPMVMLVCLICTKAIKSLKIRHWLVMFAIAILPCAIWAVARYTRDGLQFLQPMLEYDLLARAATQLVPSVGFRYYLDYALHNLDWRNAGMQTAALLGVLALGAKLKRSPDEQIRYDARPLSIALAAWFLIPAVVVSAIKTKLGWYIFPAIIPLLAIAAIMLCRLIRKEYITLLSATLAALLCIGLCNTIRLNMVEAKDMKNDQPRQIFFETCLTRDAEYAGKDCYWAKVDQIGFWEQGDMLQAELSGNLICRNGGYEAYLEHDDSLLLVKKDDLPDGLRMEEFRILGEDATFALLER